MTKIIENKIELLEKINSEKAIYFSEKII